MDSLTFITNGDTWSALALTGLAGIAAAFVIALARHRPLSRTWLAAAAATAVGGAAGAIAFSPHPDDALVVTEDASLTISPIDHAEPTTPVATGTTVRIENTHGAFAYVHTKTGDTGWLPQSSLDRYVGEWDDD